MIRQYTNLEQINNLPTYCRLAINKFLVCVSNATGINRVSQFAHQGSEYVYDGIQEMKKHILLPISQRNIEQELMEWVNAATVEENRNEAAQRIRRAFYISSFITPAADFLDLSNLGLRTLPTFLRYFSVNELDVSRNYLTSPEGFPTIHERLNVSNNLLTTVPETFTGTLTHLYAGNNLLTSLPQRIGSLRQLMNLSVANNQLTALPENIFSLWRNYHCSVDLDGNPITLEVAQHIEYMLQEHSIGDLYINLPLRSSLFFNSTKIKLTLIVPNEIEATQLEKSFATYIKKVVKECVPHYLTEENVVDVLDAVVSNINGLRNQVFKLAQEGIDNCADNRIKTFNEMQLHTKIATVLADTTLTDKTKALFDLFKGLYRQELLAGFTEQIMLERWAIKNPGQFKDGVPVDNKGQKTAPHLKEALEVELGLRYLLKDKLQLAFPVREMKYLRLAEEYMSDSLRDPGTVSEKAAIKTQEAEQFVLQQEKDKDAFVLWLTSQPAWVTFLKQENEAELQGINEANQQALENERPDVKNENFYDLPQEEQDSKLIEYQTILKEREEQQQLDFYKQKTEIILQGFLSE